MASRLPAMTVSEVRGAIDGLPQAGDYQIVVKPLRYRTEPSLSAMTEFDERRITIQVPEPFHPFGAVVPYGAKRMPGRSMRFVPLSEGVTFRSRAEVVRFLYCHEWYHWFLWEVMGTASQAETACDRFALRNYRRRTVTMADARAALRRRREGSIPRPAQTP
ncbi:MAG TPA: hypothetical protein VGB52_04800 [Actinomycetota bacterium]